METAGQASYQTSGLSRDSAGRPPVVTSDIVAGNDCVNKESERADNDRL